MMDKVLILGGGYAGVYAALAAARARGGARLEIGLVSNEPDLVNRPRLYEPNPGPNVRYPLEPMLDLAQVSFEVGEVIAIDADSNEVRLSDGRALIWDRLILGLGSQTVLPPLPGIERVFDVGSYAGARAFNAHLDELPLGAPVRVVGSGFTGLEVATELAARFEVTIIERADVVAPYLGEAPRNVILRALDELQIEARLRTTLDRIDDITTVWCGGRSAHPLTRSLPAERDRCGRLITEPTLKVRGLRDVYAAGDVALAMTDDEHPALMSCQHAIKLGQYAGNNAVRDLLGQNSLPYRQPRYRMCLDLGRAGAVITDGWDYQVIETGAKAKAVKREVNRVWAALPQAADRNTLLAYGEPGTSRYRSDQVAA